MPDHGGSTALQPSQQPEQRPASRAHLFRALGLVLAVNVVVALLAADGVIADDADSYVRLARNLAANQGYVFEQGGEPTSWRAPVYPIFLSLVFWLTSGSLIAARLAQAVLSTTSAVLAWRLARRRLGHREALWAGLLVGLFPELVGLTGLLWSEPIFHVLFLSTFLLILNAVLDARGRAWALAAGLLLGLAVLTRSTAVILFPVLGLAVRLARSRRVAARRALTTTVVGLLILGSWTGRNWLIHGRFILVESNASLNLFLGNNPLTPTPFAWRALAACRETNCLAEADRLNEGDKYARLGAEAIGYIRTHLGLTAGRALAKGMDFWLPDFFVARNAKRGALGPLLVPLWWATLALTVTCFLLVAAAGLHGLWRARTWAEGQLCLLVLLLYTLPHCLVFGASRHHLPLIPLLIIFAVPDLRAWAAALARPLRPGRS